MIIKARTLISIDGEEKDALIAVNAMSISFITHNQTNGGADIYFHGNPTPLTVYDSLLKLNSDLNRLKYREPQKNDLMVHDAMINKVRTVISIRALGYTHLMEVPGKDFIVAGIYGQSIDVKLLYDFDRIMGHWWNSLFNIPLSEMNAKSPEINPQSTVENQNQLKTHVG